MLSIYDSKFAPILWFESTHLSFCFRFSLFSLSLAVLNNRFLWLLSFRILCFSSTEFSRDFRGMITLSKLSAHSFDPAIATRFPVAVYVPAFSYIDIANSNGSGLSQNNKARKLLNRKSFVCSECTRVRVLRAPDRKYQNSHDRSEISDFILFHLNVPFGELF